MKNHWYLWLIACLSLGMLFFFYQESWLIINLPFQFKHMINSQQNESEYQKIPIYVYNNSMLQQEVMPILKTKVKTKFLKDLISKYLQLYQEIQQYTECVNVEHVAYSNESNELIVSFNKNPLRKQISALEKFLFVAGLVQTIKNIHPCTSIHLLVNHQPLQDDHLNFQFPWLTNQFDLCKT